eukprot:3336879-Amphidinium_carterae.1
MEQSIANTWSRGKATKRTNNGRQQNGSDVCLICIENSYNTVKKGYRQTGTFDVTLVMLKEVFLTCSRVLFTVSVGLECVRASHRLPDSKRLHS